MIPFAGYRNPFGGAVLTVASYLPLSFTADFTALIGLQAYAKVCLDPTPGVDISLQLVSLAKGTVQVGANAGIIKGGIRLDVTVLDTGVGPAFRVNFDSSLSKCFHVPARIKAGVGAITAYWNWFTCWGCGKKCWSWFCVPYCWPKYCGENTEDLWSYPGYTNHFDLYTQCKKADWKPPVASKSVRVRQVRPGPLALPLFPPFALLSTLPLRFPTLNAPLHKHSSDHQLAHTGVQESAPFAHAEPHVVSHTCIISWLVVVTAGGYWQPVVGVGAVPSLRGPG
jgi:hypothetical protein